MRARAGGMAAALVLLTGCAGPSPGSMAPAGPGASSGTGQRTATPGLPPGPSAVPGASPASAPPRPPAQLPRGGRTIFPTYRLFGFSGSPGSAAFGRLGTGDLDARVREIERRGQAFAKGRKLLPVLELIAVVAHESPGVAGTYNGQVSDAVIGRYLAAARRHRALLLLNVQPGREGLLTVVKRFEPWLRQPDVGVALDPEWEVHRGQVPGRVFGSTTGAELDSVSAYLDALVRAHRLPQKVMVFHQVAPGVLSGQQRIRARAGVVVIKSVDGIGNPRQKTDTWRLLVRGLPRSVHPGFKLFFDEDARYGPLMSASQVLALRPTPEYVLYE